MKTSNSFKFVTLASLAAILSANAIPSDAFAKNNQLTVINQNLSTRSPQNEYVRLLIPVKSGLEFSKLQKVYDNVKILEKPSGIVVLVSTFNKATDAYKLGKKIQSVYGYSFQLSYSNNHPDLNMAWLRSINSNLASFIKNKNVDKLSPKAITSKKPLIKYSTKAEDLGILTMKSPVLVGKTKEPSNLNGTNSPLATINLSSVRQNLSNSSKNSPTKLSKTNLSSIPKVNPLINAVAIQPVDLGNLSIMPARHIAVNTSINYVYANITSNIELAKLRKLNNNLTVLRDSNNNLIAKVGVFTNSKVGIRLRDNKVALLKSKGLSLKVFRPTTIA